MVYQNLTPSLDVLSQEYVLVQAWKKTSAYIRNHNWYSDTLELDRTAINLPKFIEELARSIRETGHWLNDPLRIVPAPKSQHWHVERHTGKWKPEVIAKTESKLRPLAHVSLRDQVVATAVMLCIADRVETIQGDPRQSIEDEQSRRKITSYGNRLFCDSNGDSLRHRWGSGTVYRAYFQDYRKFLARPELVAEQVMIEPGRRVVIVHSDLKQFYDRVRPDLLSKKLTALIHPDDDENFFLFAAELMNWKWHRKDSREVAGYAKRAGLEDFSTVALPQGLVSAGFFANIVLLDFDKEIRNHLGTQILPGVTLRDGSRYVDDLRLVVEDSTGQELDSLEQSITNFLQSMLQSQAAGMEVSRDKTRAAAFRGDNRPLIRQSRKMERIQTAVSGGFDIAGGQDALAAIQGLIRSQERFSEQRLKDQQWDLAPIPDVRDSTVARFAAGRFRTTYRSVRPLLADAIELREAKNMEEVDSMQGRFTRSREELDDEAKAFALGLIESWISDPSNVRLLRIGLDIWPDADVLESTLKLLRPFTQKGGLRKAPRRVAWYCLAEILRAGATETGFVEDAESLSTSLNIDAYRELLRKEALRLVAQPASTLPWYLRQQALLFIAVSIPNYAAVLRTGTNPETKRYRELIQFLHGDAKRLTGAEFATYAVLARRSFRTKGVAKKLATRRIGPRLIEHIAERDPSFAVEVIESKRDVIGELSPRVRDDLCLKRSTELEGWVSLASIVIDEGSRCRLRNELAITEFAWRFLDCLTEGLGREAVLPCDVMIKIGQDANGIARVAEVRVDSSAVSSANSMYRVPRWCPDSEWWRFNLGFLLRFILAARHDFSRTIRLDGWKEDTVIYRAAEAHWYQRLYGMYNGHTAFGDDWLPISDWTERLLFGLLRWPGCREVEQAAEFVEAAVVRHKLFARFHEIQLKQGASSTLVLPLAAPQLVVSPKGRPLRACVIQTVIPGEKEFSRADLTLSDPNTRRRHRNHLSASLAAVEKMLDLRETHLGREGRLDLLILPELAVHPRDVKTHLIPFVRAHKTIVIAGLVFEELFSGQPLTNSALWIIPVVSDAHGLQVITRRQGKKHLSPAELSLNATGNYVQGFRPAQWLVGYQWSPNQNDPLLWLTASICYDATDVRLTADLRHQSDVYIVPALNKDVGTFDNMALALNYHMFQLVIVANNGSYGGSNAYAPYNEPYARQVFHLHGQPQASVAFFEIDDVRGFI